MFTTSEPITSKYRLFNIPGIALFGWALINIVRNGLGFWQAGRPEPDSKILSAPTILKTTRAFQNKLLDQKPLRLQTATPIPMNFQPGANRGGPAASGGLSRVNAGGVAASVVAAGASVAPGSAGKLFGFVSQLSWTALGIAGLVGALGTAYLIKRYMQGSGIQVTNTNNNNVHINIHFSGVNPAAPPVIEKKGDQTTIYMKMDKPILRY